MDPRQLDADFLRRLMLDIPEPAATRRIALLVSLTFLVLVLNLVRRGRLKEEYTPIWVVVAVGIMMLSLWSDLLRGITHFIGAWTSSSTLFFLGEMFLLVLCLNYAVRLSRLSTQVKVLAQELALLKHRQPDRGESE